MPTQSADHISDRLKRFSATEADGDVERIIPGGDKDAEAEAHSSTADGKDTTKKSNGSTVGGVATGESKAVVTGSTPVAASA